MRWLGLVLLYAVFVSVSGEPDPEPKKYNKIELKPIVNNNTTLTDEERQFLREVEAKFGIKSEVPLETTTVHEELGASDKDTAKPTAAKLPFPAVIAIEIVNDTESKGSKGKKRTIDANLGYGYRTNNGYTYTYLGKPAQEQGKFMIYPYSQKDIPPASSSSSSHSGYPQQSGEVTKLSAVEITPSQAYELIPTKESDETSYNYEKPAVQLNTKYENVQSVETPPPPYPSGHQTSHPSTLYTTFNGQKFSGLSGQFPKVMANYLVDPSQLLNNPTYQSAGLTQDHLRPHGASLEQRVVPVLVLRIPSSYIKNPSAELYANLQQNYPLSQYLNSVNLQELVNQYFRKIGFSSAPKVMTYHTASLYSGSHPSHTESLASPVSSYEQPQHYASPYIQPKYTHEDYSGVQYSAVQPVMAKYPSGYIRQHYYVMQPQTLYQKPLHQQRYVYHHYRYQIPQTATHGQSHYTQSQQPQYHQEVEEEQPQYQHHIEQEHVEHNEQPSVQDTGSQYEYTHQQSSSGDEEHPNSAEYATYHSQTNQEHEHEQEQEHEEPQHVTPTYESVTTATPSYDHIQKVSTPDYGPTKVPLSFHGSTPSLQIQYYQHQPEQKETIAIIPRSQTGHKPPVVQNYIYQKINNEHSGSESLVLTENYPSKDHTIATVLPLSYRKHQPTESVQSVSYVTPEPTMKFHSQYRIMVPQTVFRRPSNEKVSYVNSHSIPSGYSNSASPTQYSPVDPEEHSTGSHYVPALNKQKSSSYSRNYSHLKRMAKPENKSDSQTTTRKNERSEKKKSS